MLIDARRESPGSTIDCDLCIVGAGPAGITLARELDDGQRTICLLETGGLGFETRTQSLLAMAEGSDDYPPLQATRIAALGGSTRVWAGWCRPLDPIDFEHRPEIPSSGWPMSRADLDSYYVRAHAALGLGPFDYELPEREDGLVGPLSALARHDVSPILFRKSDTNFAHVHVAALRRSQQVRALLHASVLRIRYSDDGRRAIAVEVRVTDRRTRLEVRPKTVVLAAGGVENARLLLLSDVPGGRGPVNRYDVVGRYFTEHCYVDAGTFRPGTGESLAFFFPHASADRTRLVRGAYAPAPSVMRRRALLNCSISLRPAYESDPAFDDSGVRSLLRVWDMCRGRAVPHRLGSELLQVAGAPGRVLHALAARLRSPAAADTVWRLRSLVECSADSENRVELGDEVDALGRPLSRIRWRPRDFELRSVADTHALFARAVQCAGLGQVTPVSDREEWCARMEPALHHMGTTRMHDDPARGVVDRDARVHGIDNLYVTGGSVFPTGGFANPTLTILALTLRLAAHLKTRGIDG